MQPKTLVAKFPDTCKHCRGAIERGSVFVWDGKAAHVKCPAPAYPYNVRGFEAHLAELPKVGTIRFHDSNGHCSVDVFTGIRTIGREAYSIWAEVAKPKHAECWKRWANATQINLTTCG